MSAREIIDIYISFFEKRGHKRIPNSPLVPENDPTTLFTSSGMQPLVPYLLGEPHPEGNRLVNVQNCFRAVDIDEVGDNRHTTFFRMLGNWSLGGYFKELQLPWFFEFLTKELGINPERLYVSVFSGFEAIPTDVESERIWKDIFEKAGIDPKDRILPYGADKNWWSRTGGPKEMPEGEIGGPDSEVFYDFGEDIGLHEKSSYKNEPCRPNCECGRFLEIGNSVFIQYQKQEDGSFKELPKRNVDFGGGLERLLAAVENKSDIFQTSLFTSILQSIEVETNKEYSKHPESMRIIADHLRAAAMLILSGIVPSNKERGYILRRLLRRSFDNWHSLEGKDLTPVIEAIIEQGSQTDPELKDNFEKIKNTILEEEKGYKRTLGEAKKFIHKKYSSREEQSDESRSSRLARTINGDQVGDELMGQIEISADDAFYLYTSHGLSPTQIKNLGYVFDDQKFARLMEDHAKISRAGATKKFAGGLADHSEQTIRGHTATHLLHQAIRDMLGTDVYQSGSNITAERVRFDFNFDRNLTPEEISELEQKVNEKIKENLPVKFEIMSLDEAKKIGAIGLFDEKYSDKVKIYMIGPENAYYSVEFCGGPHVNFTKEVKSFKILKQENIGGGARRLYTKVG